MKHLVAVLHHAQSEKSTLPSVPKRLNRRAAQLALAAPVFAFVVVGILYRNKFTAKPDTPSGITEIPLEKADTLNDYRAPLDPTFAPIAVEPGINPKSDGSVEIKPSIERISKSLATGTSVQKPKVKNNPLTTTPLPGLSNADEASFSGQPAADKLDPKQADIEKRKDINAKILHLQKLVAGKGLRAADVPGYAVTMRSVNASSDSGDFTSAQEQLRQALISVEQFRISKSFIDNKMLFVSTLIAAKNLSSDSKRQLVTPALSKILQLAKESRFEEANGLLEQLISKLSAL
jgi:hypothetical protein